MFVIGFCSRVHVHTIPFSDFWEIVSFRFRRPTSSFGVSELRTGKDGSSDGIQCVGGFDMTDSNLLPCVHFSTDSFPSDRFLKHQLVLRFGNHLISMAKIAFFDSTLVLNSDFGTSKTNIKTGTTNTFPSVIHGQLLQLCAVFQAVSSFSTIQASPFSFGAWFCLSIGFFSFWFALFLSTWNFLSFVANSLSDASE